jgi:hypothetical protein
LLRIELIRQRESHDQDFPDEKIEGRLALALEWLVDESNALETVRRYEGQLHRAWHKCLAQLERRLPPPKDKLQSEPNSEEPKQPQQITSIDPAPPVAAAPPTSELLTPVSCILPPPVQSEPNYAELHSGQLITQPMPATPRLQKNPLDSYRGLQYHYRRLQ